MPTYKMIQCSYCPVRFAKENDFKRHMKSFGDDPKEHLGKYIDKHRMMKGTRIIDLVLKYPGVQSTRNGDAPHSETLSGDNPHSMDRR